MRSLLARLTGTPPVRVRILPECDYLFLHGYGEEAVGQHLRGKVTMFLREGESAKGVQLHLSRQLALGDHKANAGDITKWETTRVHEWDPFLIQDQPNKASKTGKLYEWPFEVFIQGDQDETFRGCGHCSNTYQLNASIIHDDSSQTLRSLAPIRIIRSPSLSAYELMDPVTEQGKWQGKIEHCVTFSHRAIALGGLIPVHAELIKHEDGVQVTKARFYLHESHTIQYDGAASYKGQRVIEQWPLDVTDRDWRVKTWEQHLELPKVVRRCSPDLDICGVTISHTLHFAATLLESGIEKEYDTSQPITLFVSPDLPIDGWGAFVRKHEKTAKDALLSEGIQAPPRYCKLDEGEKQYGVVAEPPPAYSRL